VSEVRSQVTGLLGAPELHEC